MQMDLKKARTCLRKHTQSFGFYETEKASRLGPRSALPVLTSHLHITSCQMWV